METRPNTGAGRNHDPDSGGEVEVQSHDKKTQGETVDKEFEIMHSYPPKKTVNGSSRNYRWMSEIDHFPLCMSMKQNEYEAE
ncbi:hypothetical protein M413DRAFT_440722 [Hebeloma cylindrosporum]|uniref:Uncharacterized protein n=1 Tax=Hebeloma cylindrosporum TaxID=76867 RepID=A0A0C2Z205_HEBCY|nr:hypothetical protein M413DRAFT_440722 [Hebeloma cylindrosporum h7]